MPTTLTISSVYSLATSSAAKITHEAPSVTGEQSIRRRGQEEKQTKEPHSGKSGARIWEDEPVGDGSITNDWEGASAPSHRVEQSAIQQGSVCVLDEVKLEKETKQTSGIANQSEKGGYDGSKREIGGKGIERASGVN